MQTQNIFEEEKTEMPKSISVQQELSIFGQSLIIQSLITLLILFSATTTNAQNKYDTTAIANEIRRLDKAEAGAVLKHDSLALMAIWADDLVVNTPYNFVAQGKKGGPINLYYDRLDRNIERLIIYNDSLVMTMGNEIVLRKPPMTYAGLTLTRRYTHVWMKRNGKWQLTIRHANFICPDTPKQQTK